MKRILPWMVFIVFFTLLLLGFILKDNMNNYLSDVMKSQATPRVNSMGAALVDSLYNYSENKMQYEITFLEFGSTGCSACKRMEKVMEKIQQNYPDKVNVVFYNITLHENHDLMKYFGIAAIPTQVILDKSGKEFYRHTGFISTPELTKEILKN
ncbi:MAG TPA: hypothetical protein DCG75_16740 [Bacteroidales bacterium]|nr:hypothetical protein [Bacteroidales bacterium]